MTRQRAIVSICLALLAAPLCVSGEQPALPEDLANDSRITISRRGCRGTCEVYDLTLLPSGVVLYNGVRHVKTLGRAQTRIERSKYIALLADFDRINFFSLEECGLAMDAPTTITTVAVRGRNKSVQHNYNCNGNTALSDLGDKIESMANSRQWTER